MSLPTQHALLLTTHAPLLNMSEQRRSDRKRTQTATRDSGWSRQTSARRELAKLAKPPLPARMTTWVGLCSSAGWGAARGASGRPARLALRSARLAPPDAQRQRFLDLVQQFRAANLVRAGASGW
jgi:hypothetical protein